MGLAASQAKLLTLTAVISDLEQRSQVINQRRIALSYQTTSIANEYADKMSNTYLCIDTDKQKTKWEHATFKNVAEAGYMVMGINGGKLNHGSPYVSDGKTYYKYSATIEEEMTLTKDQYEALPETIKAVATPTKDSAGNITDYKIPANTTISADLTQKEYNDLTSKLNSGEKAIDLGLTQELTYGFDNYTTNENYNGPDIETLLNSGEAQLVSKEFYYYCVSKGYKPETGMNTADYKKAVDEWELKESDVNKTGAKSVMNWRSDTEDLFEDRLYTDDDAAALAVYEAKTAEIQRIDKTLEMEEKNIETQHKAAQTQQEGLKKIIEKHIEGMKLEA